jgi:AcrR family transcriptional regulator
MMHTDPATRPALPRRSAATRTAILAAARERFACDGYERATIRAIAKEARIDPSMVMRYYGNKEGLFAAAVDLDLRVPDLGAVPRERAGEILVRHFLDVWEESEVLTALLRAGVTNSAGAARTQKIFRAQLLPVTLKICPDPEEASLRAGLCAAQMLGMALTRYILCLEPTVEMSQDAVVAWLAPTIQHYLTGPSPADVSRAG